MSYEWSLESDDNWSIVGTTTAELIALSSPEKTNSTATLTVELSDADGASATESTTVSTITNAPPEIHELSFDPEPPLKRDQSFEVKVDAEDPDGGEIEYAWSISGEWQLNDEDSATVEGISADASNDEATVEVTALDQWGDETVKSVDIRTLDYEPDSFHFQLHPSDVEPNVWVESEETVTVENFEATLTAVCHQCKVSHNGGDFAAEAEGVEAGDQLRIGTESPGFGDTKEAHVELGETTSSAWTVSTVEWGDPRVFDSCGVSGPTGPDFDQCEATYASTPLDDEVVDVDGGIQLWEVPAHGTYRIEALGAQGGGEDSGEGNGKGARIQGDFDLEKGQKLRVLVGQEGASHDGEDCEGVPLIGQGGGGGTFVADSDDNPLIVAGGGGGADGHAEIDGQTTEKGGDGHHQGTGDSGAGGQYGQAGENAECPGPDCPSLEVEADGGAGFFGSGNAQSFVDGGQGSTAYDSYGGFGGGGATQTCARIAGGGGGGYSGGGAAVDFTNAGAGGGGSYNDGANPEAESGVNTGHGQVTIDWVEGE